MSDARRLVRPVTIAAALVVAGVVIAYGAYLLLVGLPGSFVTPNLPGEPPNSAVTTDQPSIAGLFPLAAGVLLAAGLWRRRARVAWLGAFVLALYSLAFLFSSGGILIPVAAALLVDLAIAAWVDALG